MLKKADIPMHKRAGELCEEDVEKIITIMQVSFKLFRGKLILCFYSESPSVQDS